MKNSVRCDYFGEGQEIKLNINAYSRIQEKMKTPIGELLSLTRSLDITLICELLAEGLRQESFSFFDAVQRFTILCLPGTAAADYS